MSYDHTLIVEDIESILQERVRSIDARLAGRVKTNEDPEFKRGYDLRASEEKHFLKETLEQIKVLERECEDFEDEDFEEDEDDD